MPLHVRHVVQILLLTFFTFYNGTASNVHPKHLKLVSVSNADLCFSSEEMILFTLHFVSVNITLFISIFFFYPSYYESTVSFSMHLLLFIAVFLLSTVAQTKIWVVFLAVRFLRESVSMFVSECVLLLIWNKCGCCLSACELIHIAGTYRLNPISVLNISLCFFLWGVIETTALLNHH